MKKFNFKTTQEFEQLFSSSNDEVTYTIVQGIEEAMIKRSRTANLFEISFDKIDLVYEISLPSSQWPAALQQCLDYYHETQQSDYAIDTWKLLEASKVF
jgi:hypothetical protein